MQRWLCKLAFLASAWLALGSLSTADTLDEIRSRGELIWGADSEGGGPYVFPDPANPSRMTGFEVDLADRLAEALGVKARFFQGPWANLPALLGTGEIDIVLNGYELSGSRVARMEHTRPYYVFELVLLGRRDNESLTDWSDLCKPRADKFKIGVLKASAAHMYLNQHYATCVEVVVYESTTGAMRDVETGKLDATLTDTPAATFYRNRFAALKPVGQNVGKGYYVIFLRRGDERLQGALDAAIEKLLDDGQLATIYAKYGLWNEAQDELPSLAGKDDESLGVSATQSRGWEVIRSRGWLLVQAAGMTILLAALAMPLAMLLGLLVAVVRLYGPAPLKWLAVAYVEIVRGTPLLLQLFVIFYLLPEIGLAIPAFWSAIAGLAINYSAYEAEIYRAGIQAIPKGQMEAALSLGMSPAMALRRVIIPQATRIVIPPVTNDFIAMFKDTSVCSVITVMELTNQYNVQQNDTGATLELAALTALLYLMMSIPMARLANILEGRLARRPHSS